MADSEHCPTCAGVLATTENGVLCPHCALGFALDATPSFEGDTWIDGYRLIHRLGAGGMGEVWLAEQVEPFRRKVALKVIRAGMESEQIVARFEMERHALALMDHPALAKVYDAGTTSTGRPYFVMEYVDGLSITEFCDRNRLDARARLTLFLEVCEGVQHAHQKAVIHRDLKPTNVLVASDEDGRPRPKIIDFGVAKSLNDSLLERSLYTQTGVMVGTPETMSPEQASGSKDIDTRTDVYSLGVLLYGLLVGALPFDSLALREAGFAEILRVIREDTPLRPSTRFAGLAADTARVAERRGTDPGHFQRQLEGDLDWITMKALEKERDRRYNSAAELAEDIRNAMHDRPVIAGPPSAGYRIGKFVRRHRLAVGLASIALLAMVAGLVGTSHGLLRAREAESTAREEALTATQSLDFMVDLFDVSNPSEALGNSITAREILDRGVERIGSELEEQPRVRTRLMAKMAEVYTNLGLYRPAEDLIRESLEIRKRLFGEFDRDTLESESQLAWLLVHERRYAEADSILEPVLERYRLLAEADGSPALMATQLRANALNGLGRYAEARSLFERAADGLARLHGPDDKNALTTQANLGVLLTRTGEFEAARSLLEPVLENCRAALGERHPQTLGVMNILANLYADTGRYEAAEKLYRESLSFHEQVHGPDHPGTLMMRRNLGRLQIDRQDHAAAVVEYRSAWEGYQRTLGPTHLTTLDVQCFLADALRDAGESKPAEDLYLDALRATESTYGIGHRRFGFCAYGLVQLYRAQARTEDLQRVCLRFVASLREQATAENSTGEEWNNLADALLGCGGDPGEALQWAERAAADQPRDPYIRATLASALVRTGDPGGAVQALEQALELVHDAHPFRPELVKELKRLRSAGDDP